MNNLLVLEKYNEDGTPSFRKYTVVDRLTPEMKNDADNEYFPRKLAITYLKNNPFDFHVYQMGNKTGIFTTVETLNAVGLKIEFEAAPAKKEKAKPKATRTRKPKVKAESKAAPKTKESKPEPIIKPIEPKTGIEKDFE